MPWLASTGLDLDDAVGDLGHLELEQPLDEPGMRAAHDDLRALRRLAHLDDVRLDARPGSGRSYGTCSACGSSAFDSTEVEQGVAAVVLLDDAGDDVAFAAGVLLVLLLAVDLPQALGHHLLGRLRGDAAEVGRGDVDLVAVGLAVLVDLLREHAELERVGVDRDPRVLVRVLAALVRGLERVGQRAQEGVDGDASLRREHLERFHHVQVAHELAFAFFLSAAGLVLPGFGAGPHSKTVRAFSISSYRRV